MNKELLIRYLQMYLTTGCIINDTGRQSIRDLKLLQNRIRRSGKEFSILNDHNLDSKILEAINTLSPTSFVSATEVTIKSKWTKIELGDRLMVLKKSGT